MNGIPADIAAVDIGSKTAARYRDEIMNAKTVFVNGPMGVFEKPESELGTKTVWQALADTEGFSVLGGGDSIT
ncbi:MAG: phosphoglycerate kinase, partial [Clostridia bacterium]|nr:phosphoglycerate kinase [Clostridia bacterium]